MSGLKSTILKTFLFTLALFIVANSLAYAGADLGAFRAITIPQGGTGTSTRPLLKQILIGDGNGDYIVDDFNNYGELNDWEFYDANTITPTTTVGILVNSSSTISNLNFTNSTGTSLYINDDITFDSMDGLPSTYHSVNDWFKLTTSAGRISGGAVTSPGANTIDVAAGTGFIRILDDDISQVKFIDWTASSSIDITGQTNTYVGVEYNAGSPRIVTKTSDTWDLDTEFPLASVVNDETGIHAFNNPWWVSDGLTNIIETLDGFGRVRRDENIGGLILSVAGTRNPQVTAGTLRYRLNEFNFPAFDTTGSDQFELYWYNGVAGTWNNITASQYPVLQWNDTTLATLQTMTTNWYGNFWVYLEADDGDVALLYPQAQYATPAQAEAATPPTLLPAHIRDHGLLIGRILFRQNTNTPIEVQSSFTTMFTSAVVTDHGNLAGLADDDHPQYGALAQAETVTGLWNFSSGATFANSTTTGHLYIPSSTTCSPAIAGDLCIDTTSDQVKVYGGSSRVLNFRDEKCFSLESPTDADDDVPIWSPNNNITITDAYCRVQGGTSAVITLSDGTNNMDSITCSTTGQADDGSLANNTWTANERMEFDTGTVTGAVTWVNYCFTYTIDAD